MAEFLGIASLSLPQKICPLLYKNLKTNKAYKLEKKKLYKKKLWCVTTEKQLVVLAAQD